MTILEDVPVTPEDIAVASRIYCDVHNLPSNYHMNEKHHVAQTVARHRMAQGREVKVLTLPLNGNYFDQIAAGEKLEEYRLSTPFWHKRIAGRWYEAVVLTRGYPKGGGVEGETRLTRAWRGYRETEITHPHFGDKPVSVFAIDVSATLSTHQEQSR